MPVTVTRRPWRHRQPLGTSRAGAAGGSRLESDRDSDWQAAAQPEARRCPTCSLHDWQIDGAFKSTSGGPVVAAQSTPPRRRFTAQLTPPWRRFTGPGRKRLHNKVTFSAWGNTWSLGPFSIRSNNNVPTQVASVMESWSDSGGGRDGCQQMFRS